MRSYMRYYCEAFRLPIARRERDRRAPSRCDGDEAARARLRRAARPVVVFVGHLGNWDLAGAWSARHLAPVTTVAERLEPEEVFQEFLAFRQPLGMTSSR